MAGPFTPGVKNSPERGVTLLKILTLPFNISGMDEATLKLYTVSQKNGTLLVFAIT